MFDVSLFGDLNGVASHQYTFEVGQTQLLNWLHCTPALWNIYTLYFKNEMAEYYLQTIIYAASTCYENRVMQVYERKYN